MELREAIKRLRGARTQPELGRSLGVGGLTVWKWEKGHGKPSFRYLWQMAKATDGELRDVFLEALANQVGLPAKEIAGGLGMPSAENRNTMSGCCDGVDPQVITVLCGVLTRPRSEAEQIASTLLWGLAKDRGAIRR